MAELQSNDDEPKIKKIGLQKRDEDKPNVKDREKDIETDKEKDKDEDNGLDKEKEKAKAKGIAEFKKKLFLNVGN